MRTTLNLEDGLVREAMKATGIEEKTKLVRMGLQALIQEQARKRLARMFGVDKKAKAPPRRRFV